jgi:predicted O-linked N-acetylglucosamine transferase (SPINDLY family)
VLTLCGGSFASRVASSLLHDLDLPELISFSYRDYYFKAFQYSANKSIKEQYIKKLDKALNKHAWPISANVLAESFKDILINF